MADVSTKLLGQFVDNLERDVLGAGEPAAHPAEATVRRGATPPPARPRRRPSTGDGVRDVEPALAADRLARGRAGRPARDGRRAGGGACADRHRCRWSLSCSGACSAARRRLRRRRSTRR